MKKPLRSIPLPRASDIPRPVWLAIPVVIALGCELVVIVGQLRQGEMTPALLGFLAVNIAAAVSMAWLARAILGYRSTGRKARDEEFAKVSRRLDLAMEVSQIGFWDVDLDTDTLRWDARACQLMGVPYRDGYFTEADWLGAIHPDDRSRAGAAAEAAIETGGQFISDYRVLWPDGEVRHLRDMAAFYRSSSGRPRIAGLVWDVTADKEREAELELRRNEAEAANKAKSSFLAAMSHEIRTPLAGVIGMLDLMQADALPLEQAERARVASASAHSLLRLLNDVLDLSKLEATVVSLSPEPVDVRRLVAEVSDLMAARAAQKRLSFSCDVDKSVPAWVSLDPVRFRQVLTNIVSNAIAYTDHGFVAIRVGSNDGADRSDLKVEVEDSGIGVARSDRGRIFERFVQADASARRHTGGTGLGLAIARELVELMGGRISVDSCLGAGSTFTFSLPAEWCESPAVEQEPAIPAQGSTPPLDILVAEDNATNRFLIGSLLRKGGHRVTIVENGREAVEAIRESGYDVVLMDVQMPEMDGLAASRAIRALGTPNGDVPIIALTASVMSDDRARYLEAGMTDCLAKPLDVPSLNVALSRSAPPDAGQGRPEAAAALHG